MKINYPTDSEIDSVKDSQRFSAWNYLKSLREEYGKEKVCRQLYIWFTYDAKTLSYPDAGIHRLLTLSEEYAVYVLWNVHKHLDDEGICWDDFVKMTKK
jgi:hypothetical protein